MKLFVVHCSCEYYAKQSTEYSADKDIESILLIVCCYRRNGWCATFQCKHCLNHWTQYALSARPPNHLFLMFIQLSPFHPSNVVMLALTMLTANDFSDKQRGDRAENLAHAQPYRTNDFTTQLKLIRWLLLQAPFNYSNIKAQEIERWSNVRNEKKFHKILYGLRPGNIEMFVTRKYPNIHNIFIMIWCDSTFVPRYFFLQKLY